MLSGGAGRPSAGAGVGRALRDCYVITERTNAAIFVEAIDLPIEYVKAPKAIAVTAMIPNEQKSPFRVAIYSSGGQRTPVSAKRMLR
jgi:hypothetical protein